MATKKKRQVPSVGRQLALALVALIEDIYAMHNVEADKAMEIPIKTARDVLNANGYADLKSIRSRVAVIQARIAQAVEVNDGAALAKLGAELDRAKAGKPPLNGEKKPKMKKAEPTAPKPARASRKSSKNEVPGLILVPVKCTYSICQWKGEGVVGSPCPDCDAPLVAVEKEA